MNIRNPMGTPRRRLSLDLPAPLHTRLKTLAAQAGEPCRAIVERATVAELLRLERRIEAARGVADA